MSLGITESHINDKNIIKKRKKRQQEALRAPNRSF